MNKRPGSDKKEAFPILPSEKSMSVLIVGGKEALEGAPRILDSLAIMGFPLRLIGVVYWSPKKLPNRFEPCPDIRVFHDYTKPIAEEAPDLLIITSDDHRLLKRLTEIIPPKTRVLDSFALDAFRALKNVSGQLGRTENVSRDFLH